MSLGQVTKDFEEELSLRLKAIYECDEKIKASKEIIKNFNASKKDAFKALAERLEIKVNVLKRGYKEYIALIENPEESKGSDEIVAMLQTFNLLKKEK
jgi:DNA-directed RNA polymerase specialized sigma54-like protein